MDTQRQELGYLCLGVCLWIASVAAVGLIVKMRQCPPSRNISLLMAVPIGAVALVGLCGCTPHPVKKSEPKSVSVAEPQWRHVRTDEESATFMTPAIQTVGAYKRFWLAEVFAKPKPLTVRGDMGLAATRTDLIEVDCEQTRVRALQSTFMDEKDWSGTDTPEKPQWHFVNPDAQNIVTVRHACAGEKLTGTGYPSMKAARLSYRSSIQSDDAKGRAVSSTVRQPSAR